MNVSATGRAEQEPGVHAALPAARSTPVQSAPKPSPTRLYALDGLRLVAALGVVAFHWTGVDLHPEVWGEAPSTLMPQLHRIGAYGWVGVQLFFLISGFVICRSCWGKPVRAYVTSRAVRLFPAYWIGIVLTTLVVNYAPTVRHDRRPLRISEVLTNLTMLQRPLGATEVDGVYWTLWTELRFYLLFAVLAAVGLTYRRVLAFCMIWSVLAVVAADADNALMGLALMPNDAPYFIAGVLLHLIHRFGPSPLLLGAVAFQWLIAQNRIPATTGGYVYEVRHPLSWLVVAALSALAFLLVLGAALGVFDRIRWRWLTTAGALTYPLYLLHQEIGWALIRLGRDHRVTPVPLLLSCLTVLLALSWAVHRFGERPLGALGKRLLEMPPPRPRG